MAEITTIARPYAQAVFKLASAAQALDEWSDTLALLALITTDPEMQRVIDNPRLTSEQLVGLYIDIGGEALDEEAGNLLRVLAENGRLPVLPEIYRLYHAAKSEAEGAIQAELITAYPATEAQKTQVLEALKQRFGRAVELDCKTDPALMGGAVIRAGDQVIDGSVRGKLDKLAAVLSH